MRDLLHTSCLTSRTRQTHCGWCVCSQELLGSRLDALYNDCRATVIQQVVLKARQAGGAQLMVHAQPTGDVDDLQGAAIFAACANGEAFPLALEDVELRDLSPAAEQAFQELSQLLGGESKVIMVLE